MASFILKISLSKVLCVNLLKNLGGREKGQHILNVSRAFTFHSNNALNLWNFSIKHDIDLINRIPSPLINYKCPYEILLKVFPVIIHLKVSGYLCFVTTLQAHGTKSYIMA